MKYIHIGLGVVSSAAWIPILVFFFKNFRKRNNPVSLAIGTLIALCLVYVGPVYFWLLSETADKDWVLVTCASLNIAVSVHFYLAIRWSKRKFPDSRNLIG